jgi:hypothetical protein
VPSLLHCSVFPLPYSEPPAPGALGEPGTQHRNHLLAALAGVRNRLLHSTQGSRSPCPGSLSLVISFDLCVRQATDLPSTSQARKLGRGETPSLCQGHTSVDTKRSLAEGRVCAPVASGTTVSKDDHSLIPRPVTLHCKGDLQMGLS